MKTSTFIFILFFFIFTSKGFGQNKIEIPVKATENSSEVLFAHAKKSELIAIGKSYNEDYNNTIELYNTRTGKKMYTHTGRYTRSSLYYFDEQAEIFAHVFNQPVGGKTVYKIYLLSLKSFNVIDSLTFNLDIGNIRSIPNSRQLLITTKKNFEEEPIAIYRYNLDTKQLDKLNEFKNQKSLTFEIDNLGKDLAFIPDDYYNNKIIFKNISNFKDSVKLKDFAGRITPYPLPNGNFLLTSWNPCAFYIANRSGVIQQVELENYEKILNIDASGQDLNLLVQKSPDGKQTAILTYSLKDFSFINSYNSTPEHTISFNLVKHNLSLISLNDNKLTINETTYKPTASVLTFQPQTTHTESITKIITHFKKPFIATYGYDHKIKIWDLRLGLIITEIVHSIDDMIFSESGDELFFTENDNIYIYDIARRRIKQSVKINDPSKFSTQSPLIGLSADINKIIIWKRDDNSIQLLDASKGILKSVGSLKCDADLLIPLVQKDLILYRTFDTSDKNRLDNFIFSTATTSGKKNAEIKIKGYVKHQLNQNQTALAVLKTVNDEKEHSWSYQMETYSLPNLKLTNSVNIKSSVKPALNNSFTQIATSKGGDLNSDSLVVLNFPSKSLLRALKMPTKYSGSEFGWSGNDELVTIKDSYNYFSTASNTITDYKLKATIPAKVLINASLKKMWVKDDKGLHVYKLNNLEKAKTLDSNSIGELINNSVDNLIFYTNYHDNKISITAIDTSGKFLFSIPSKPGKCVIQVGKNVVIARENAQKELIILETFDLNGKFLTKDSVTGNFPVVFSNVKPLMSVYNKTDNEYNLYDLTALKKIDEFKAKAQRYNQVPPVFSKDDLYLYSAPKGYQIQKTYLQDFKTVITDLNHITEVKGLALSPNGENILVKSGIKNDEINVLDANSFKTKKKLAEYVDGFKDFQFVNDTIFVTQNTDGTIRFHNIKSGSNFLIMMTDDDQHLLYFDPTTNFYASTRKDPKALAFNYKDKVVPFLQFDAKLNRPAYVLQKLPFVDPKLLKILNIVQVKRAKLMGIPTDDEKFTELNYPILSILNIQNLPLTTNEQSINLQINASDSTSKLVSLHVVVNGNPIYGRSGLVFKPTNITKQNINVLISNGVNKVEVYVSNAKGIESIRENFQIDCTKPATAGNFHFIGIGASKYKNKAANLTYAAKDIRDMAKAIKTKYPTAIIDTLFDEQVTPTNLRNLKANLLKSNIEDKVMLLYAGHGLLSDSLDFYFGTYSMDFAKPQINGWSFNDMENLLDGIPARQKLMLIDACHSGELDKDEDLKLTSKKLPDGTILTAKGARGVELISNQTGLENSFELMKELFTNTNIGSGTIVISAAGGKEYALEGPKWNNGVFTYAMLEAMQEKKADENSNQKIDLNELKNFLQSEVLKLTGGQQKPTVRQENVLFNWNIW